jgi:hypothetical protein
MLTQKDISSRRQGLCLNCMYPPNCGHLRENSPAVVHCEEHATTGLPAVVPGKATALTGMPTHDAVTASNGLKGLCTNCALSATCRMAKPKGGVWHCNEYR